MHSQGIAHRDLKVENFMIHGDGSLKICDFGLSTDKVMSKSRAGTELYMASEQYAMRLHDPKKADFFSLGVILFVMVNCAFPFRLAHEDDGTYSLLRNGKISEFWELHEKLLETPLCVSDNMRDLIIKLMAHDPQERPDFSSIRSHPWF